MLSQSKRKVALFTSLCLFCTLVELVIPKPSFIRIGLSNIPVMLALYCSFSVSEYICLVVSRIILQAVVNGTLFSYAFVLSASAGIASSFFMYFAYKIPDISFVGISEIGAFFSNIVQIYVSHFFLGNGVYSLAPLILACGVVSSFILGVFTSGFCKRSEFLKTIQNSSFFAGYYSVNNAYGGFKISFNRISKLILGCLALFVCLFTDKIAVSGIICFGFLIACIVNRRHIRFIPVVWTILRTVLISLLIPSGKIIFDSGIVKITLDSVILGLNRSFIILSSCWFSRFIIPSQEEVRSAFAPDSLVYLTLSYFKEITEQWFSVDYKNHTVRNKEKIRSRLGRRIDATLLKAVRNCSNLNC